MGFEKGGNRGKPAVASRGDTWLNSTPTRTPRAALDGLRSPAMTGNGAFSAGVGGEGVAPSAPRDCRDGRALTDVAEGGDVNIKKGRIFSSAFGLIMEIGLIPRRGDQNM